MNEPVIPEIERKAYEFYRYRVDHGGIRGNENLDYRVARTLLSRYPDLPLTITDVQLDSDYGPIGYRLYTFTAPYAVWVP